MEAPVVESPFVGLVPYTGQDARFFFGREREQRLIIANLFASRLTILYGASGVGKSSVLRADVVTVSKNGLRTPRPAANHRGPRWSTFAPGRARFCGS